MKLEKIVSQFLSLTVDAVAIARRTKGECISRYEWVNDPFCEMFGMGREEAIGSLTRRIHHDDYFDEFYGSVAEALMSGQNQLSMETLCVRKNGNAFWASVSMFILPDPDEEGFYSAVVLRDISGLKERERAAEQALVERERYAQELERANIEISHQATHDELTGLGNRRFLNNKLDEFVRWRERNGMEIATLHIDLDRFKQINDTMGHAAGDFVLEAVSERLQSIMRRTDMIARVGGDEFITIMRCEEGSSDPERLAIRLVDDLSRPLMFEGRQCRFGASVGIARTPLVAPEDLLTSSDIALYKAKESGRSQVMTFDESDLAKLKFNKHLTHDIQLALEHSEFIPYYQPQVDPRTFNIVGFETLARWKHPQRGLLAPADFLSAASDIRVDGQIDRMIFGKALDQFTGLFAGAADVPNLSFNASLQRIMDPSLIEDVERLRDYRGKVSLELLEAIFLEEESDHFLMRIDTLRDYGLTFEVDDFGSGRASIVALKRIAPERLKIDGRLVAPITKSVQARKLVQSMVEIGRTLDIGVTAEGVETAEHARILRDMGCARVQGYHFARPMCFEDVAELMRNGQPFAQSA